MRDADDWRTAVDRAVGQAVRHRRQQLGLSQSELERAIGAAQGTVTGLESGRRTVQPAELLGLSDVLNVPISFFFAAVDKRPAPIAAPTANLPAAREVVRFVTAYYRIPSRRQRREVLALVRTLGEEDPETAGAGVDVLSPCPDP